MLKSIYEGTLLSLFRLGTAEKAGTFVAYDDENPGFVKKAGKNDAVGVTNQDMLDYSGMPFGGYRSVVHPISEVGDKMGVYIEGGVYATDMFDDDLEYKPGEDLYWDGTQLTNVDPTDGKVVATVVKESGEALIFQLLL